MKLRSPWRIDPQTKVKLAELQTDADGGYPSHAASTPVLEKHVRTLAGLQEILFAGQKHAVLIVLQGMDTAGKDGTISHIFSGVNPQGCNVASFKVPTPLEARHDFLWRCHAKAPALGDIAIFNRSHYEQVLSPRVHGHITSKEAHRNMEEINGFERMLFESGTLILKFFLNISRKEQTKRLEARIDDPSKHWKLSPSDFAERAYWEDYQEAYADILSRTSTAHAPWFAIPSDHKWFRNLAVSEVLVEAFQGLDLAYPKPSVDLSKLKLD